MKDKFYGLVSHTKYRPNISNQADCNCTLLHKTGTHRCMSDCQIASWVSRVPISVIKKLDILTTS